MNLIIRVWLLLVELLEILDQLFWNSNIFQIIRKGIAIVKQFLKFCDFKPLKTCTLLFYPTSMMAVSNQSMEVKLIEEYIYKTTLASFQSQEHFLNLLIADKGNYS